MKNLITALLAMLFLVPSSVLAATSSSAGTLGTATSEWEFDRSNKTFRIHFGEETQDEAIYDEDDLLNIYRSAKNKLFGGDVKWDAESRKTYDDYRIWDMFAGIAGKDFIKKYLGAYATYRVPEVPVLAFVTKAVGAKEPSWILAVNANGADFNSNTWQRDMAITLLHEYGHLVTLNKTQVNNDKRNESVCKSTVFIHSRIAGCSTKKSYINVFVQKFWTQDEIDTALAEVRKGKGTDSFYRANRSSFVTKYASTGPVEDIAESYADFILRNKPAGTTEKEQKILFFYDYPELVKERTRVRSAIVGYLHL